MVADNLYLLSAFEVTELICWVITKRTSEGSGEKLTLDALQQLKTPKPSELNKLLEKCNPSYSEIFSQEKFTPEGEKKAGKGKFPLLLYHLALRARRGQPYILAESELSCLFGYLGINPDDYNPYMAIEPTRLSKKLIDFEGSCWAFYYPSQDTDMRPRLGCAILEFLPFGRLRFKTVYQNYSGYYSAYGADEYYLQMHLKTIPNLKRRLNILVYCGDSKPEIMLGQYNNVEQKLSSGKSIMTPLAGEYDTLIAKHISQDTEDFNKVNEFIRQYLIDPDNKQLITYTEMIHLSAFEKYVKSNGNK